MADRQHKQRDLWLVVIAVCLTLAGGTPLTLWAVQVTAPSAHVHLWPNPFVVAAMIVSLLGVYMSLALIFGWWLPGGFKEDRATQAGPSPKPLRVHYAESPPYRRPSRELGEYRTEHRVGISNPAGNPTVTGIRVVWAQVSPWPRLFNEISAPSVPHAVPRDGGGDPRIGIDLLPGQQELWVAVSTWIGPDGLMAAGEFAHGYGTSRGEFTGFPYRLQPGDRLRFSYEISADTLPRATFSLVMTVAEGHIRCNLEG